MTRVQILDEAVCEKHKSIRSFPGMGNRRIDWFYNLDMAISLGEGKL